LEKGWKKRYLLVPEWEEAHHLVDCLWVGMLIVDFADVVQVVEAELQEAVAGL